MVYPDLDRCFSLRCCWNFYKTVSEYFEDLLNYSRLLIIPCCYTNWRGCLGCISHHHPHISNLFLQWGVWHRVKPKGEGRGVCWVRKVEWDVNVGWGKQDVSENAVVWHTRNGFGESSTKGTPKGGLSEVSWEQSSWDWMRSSERWEWSCRGWCHWKVSK